MTYEKMKQCSKCFVVKSANCFSPRSNVRDGMASWCKVCKAAAQEQSRQRNPDYDKNRYLEQKHKVLAMHQLRRVVKHGRLPEDLDPDELQFVRRLGKTAVFRAGDEMVKIRNARVSREEWCHMKHQEGVG